LKDESNEFAHEIVILYSISNTLFAAFRIGSKMKCVNNLSLSLELVILSLATPALSPTPVYILHALQSPLVNKLKISAESLNNYILPE
jgi:hypothetical protein